MQLKRLTDWLGATSVAIKQPNGSWAVKDLHTVVWPGRGYTEKELEYFFGWSVKRLSEELRAYRKLHPNIEGKIASVDVAVSRAGRIFEEDGVIENLRRWPCPENKGWGWLELPPEFLTLDDFRGKTHSLTLRIVEDGSLKDGQYAFWGNFWGGPEPQLRSYRVPNT